MRLPPKCDDAEIHEYVVRRAVLREVPAQQPAAEALEQECDKRRGDAVQHERNEQRRRLLFQLVRAVDMDEQEHSRDHCGGDQDRVGIEEIIRASPYRFMPILKHKSGKSQFAFCLPMRVHRGILGCI